MSEIGDVAQIIKVGYEGVEIAFRIGAGGLSLIKKMLDFFIGMINFEKKSGKTNMKQLLEKGGPMEVFQFREEDWKQVQKFAKEYGILYSELPDLIPSDGNKEILFSADDMPRMNLLMQKLEKCRLSSLDEYVNSGEDIDQMLKFLKDFQDPNVTTADISIEPERYEDLKNRISMIAANKDSKLVEAKIDSEQIVEFNQDQVKISVDYAPGISMWVDKRDLIWDEDEEKFRLYLDKNQEYELKTNKGEVYATVNGEDLRKSGFKEQDRKKSKQEKKPKAEKKEPKKEKKSKPKTKSKKAAKPKTEKRR